MFSDSFMPLLKALLMLTLSISLVCECLVTGSDKTMLSTAYVLVKVTDHDS
jgi:hypothetical protein